MLRKGPSGVSCLAQAHASNCEQWVFFPSSCKTERAELAQEKRTQGSLSLTGRKGKASGALKEQLAATHRPGWENLAVLYDTEGAVPGGQKTKCVETVSLRSQKGETREGKVSLLSCGRCLASLKMVLGLLFRNTGIGESQAG